MNPKKTWFQAVSLALAFAIVCDTTDLYGLRHPRNVARAAEQRKPEVTALSLRPTDDSGMASGAPSGHLPVGFDDLASFHDTLVTEAEGHFRITYQDVSIPGLGPALEIRRTYNSHVDRAGSFGKGWSWNYGIKLGRDDDTGEYVLRDENNLRVHFRKLGGAYVSVNSALRQRLEFTGGGAVRSFPNGIRQHFNSGGRLAAIEDASGRRLELRYAGSRLVEAVDSTGRSLKFTYAGDRISSITDPLGRRWRYEYSDDLLREAYDPLDRRTGYVYLPEFGWRQRMSHVKFPNGADMTIFYHPLSKRVIRIRGPGAMSSSFVHSVNPHLREMRQWSRNPRGHRSEIRFLGQGLEIEEPDQGGGGGGGGGGSGGEGGGDGSFLYLRADSIGTTRYMPNVTKVKDPEGGWRTVAADDSRITLIDQEKNTVTIGKDGEGRIASVTDQVGNQTSLSWDALGQISSISQPGGGRMSFGYERGQLSSITDALGGTTRFELLPSDKGLRVTDPTGLQRTVELDAYGYPSRLIDANGAETRFQYDVVGRMVAVSDATGQELRYVYDAADNVVEIRDRQGVVSRTTYDQMDNPLRVVDAVGRETSFEYDRRGLVTAVTHPGGLRTECKYDAAGNLVSTTQKHGGRDVTEELKYDRNHRPVQTTDALGRVFEHSYDSAGLPTSSKSPGGGRITFRHDAAGRLLNHTLADGSSVATAYGANSMPASITYRGEGRQGSAALEYDAAGRLTSIMGRDAKPRKLSYDAAGRTTKIQAGDNAVGYEYAKGQLAAMRSQVGSRVEEVRFERDNAGRVSALVLPGGEKRAYAYDASGAIASIDVPELGSIQFERDRVRGVTGLKLPKAGRIEFARDKLYRLTGITFRDGGGAAVAAFGYAYDQSGNVTSAQAPGGNLAYQYDAVWQLTRVSRGGGRGADALEQYAYDAEGNLTQTPAFNAGELKYDQANKLTSARGATWKYDERGNVVEREGTKYTYDDAGQLTRIDWADQTYAAYGYDVLGRRVEKNVNGKLTRYVYAGHDLVAELDKEGKQVARYVYGPGIDEPLAMRRDGKWYFFVSDRLGSVRALVDEAGKAVESYRYTAYGVPLSADGQPAKAVSVLHPFGFTGREYDAESGLYYYRARYYDPRVGRFLQRDPIGSAGGTNLYAYVGGNPVNFRDPLGLVPNWVEELGTSGNVINASGDALWEKWKRANADLSPDAQASTFRRYAKQMGEVLLESPHATNNTIGGRVIWQGHVDEAGGRFYRAWTTHEWLRTTGQRLATRDALSRINKVNKVANFVSLGLDTAFFLSDAYDFYHYNPDKSIYNAFRTLFPSLWPVLLDLLWLIAPVLMASAVPWVATFGAVLLAALILITLLEWFDILNADPTFVQTSPRDAPLAALRCDVVYVGAAGTRPPRATGPPIDLYDSGGKWLEASNPGDPATKRTGAAAYAIERTEPPRRLDVVHDEAPPAVELTPLPQAQWPAGRVALTLRAEDAHLADVRVFASHAGSPGHRKRLAHFAGPVKDRSLLLDAHELDEGGVYSIEAVARDLAGNEKTAAAAVTLADARQRPLAVYGLETQVWAEVLDAQAQEALKALDEAEAMEAEGGAIEPAEADAVPPAAAGPASGPGGGPGALLPDMRPAWVSGELPPGAKALGQWNWNGQIAWGAPRSHTGASPQGPSVHYFIRAGKPLTLTAQDNVIQYVYLDPAATPKQILLQLYVDAEQGEHRVYWGENMLDLGGTVGTGSLYRMGPLPKAGQWVRLRVPLERFGLRGANVTGMLFGQYDGRAYWGPTTHSPSHLEKVGDELVVAESGRAADNLEYSVEANAKFDLSADAKVRGWVQDAQGKVVAQVLDRFLPAGSHRLVWDGRDKDGKLLPDGKYTCVIEAAAEGDANAKAVRATAPLELGTLVARIALPAENSLVQATVPFFGTAAGRDFDRYELDYQVDRDAQWTSLATNNQPQVLHEPPLSLNHRATVIGNLASFTVPKSDGYGFDWSQTRTGLHTFRLRVWNKAGKVVEDRVRLRVAPVVTNGGTVDVRSPDGGAALVVPAMAMRKAFHLFDVAPADPSLGPELDAAAKRIGAGMIGSAYEVRPAGFHFARDVILQMRLPDGGGAAAANAGIYAYDPPAGSWRRLGDPRVVGGVDGKPATVTAALSELPPGRAVFALLQDKSTTAPVLLAPTEPGHHLRLLAAAEPGATVTLRRPAGGPRGDADTVQSVADSSGLAVFPSVYVGPDGGQYTALARDGAGNQAAAAAPLSVRPQATPPLDAAALKVEQGGDALVISADVPAPPAAAPPRPRRASVQVRSQSDTQGFHLDLLPDATNTSRVSAKVALARGTDPAARELAVSRDGETIHIRTASGGETNFTWKDATAPPPPHVTSLSHATWRTSRAALRSDEAFASPSTPDLIDKPVELREFPVLSFRYRIQPGSTLHLVANVNQTWHGMSATGHGFSGTSYTHNEQVRHAADLRLKEDGQWHTANINLYEIIRSRPKTAAERYLLNSLLLGQWHSTGYKEVSSVPADQREGSWEIAQVTLRRAGGPARIDVAWSEPADLSGITDYSFVLDQDPSTEPPTEGKGKVNRAQLDAPPGQGNYYFHVRARDAAGNWGQTTHFPLTADVQGPIASEPVPAPASRTAEFDIRVTLADGESGSGVDPDSVRLRVEGQTFDARSPALTYDPATRKLSFKPWRAEPPLPAWPDGKRVDVAVVDTADFAGNRLAKPFEWSFIVDYAASGAGEARMLTQQGGVEPAWSPDGKRVAYVVEGKERTLWVIEVDSGTARQIAAPLARVATPAWSPDGSTLAVSAAGPAGNLDIFFIDAVSGAVRQNLTAGAGDNSYPAWLAGGESLLFVRDGDLWRTKRDGGAAAIVFDDADGARALRPQVSRDGASVLLWRSLYDEQIWIVDLKTGAARPVTSGGTELDPAWGVKPDQLIYAKNDGSSRLMRDTLTGASPTQLLGPGGWFDRYPAVSPDGRRMVFQSTRNGFWNIWMVQWLAINAFEVSPQRYRPTGTTGATSPTAATPTTMPITSDAGPGPSHPFRISYDAQGFNRARIRVLDRGGRERVSAPIAGSSGVVSWNGMDGGGRPLEEGEYLVQFLAVAPGGGEPITRGVTVFFDSATPGQPPLSQTAQRQRASAGAPLWWLGGGLLVVAASVIAFMLWRRSRQRDDNQDQTAKAA